MTVVAKTLLEAKYAESSETGQYTAPASTRAIIDKMTVTNVTGSTATITVHVVNSGGAAGATNALINAQAVAAGTSYLCPEVTGHILNQGDFISTIAGTASALVIRISGREIV